MSTIKLNVTVDHKRFYNPDNMWGVYGVIPNTCRDKIETLERGGVFVVSGNTPELTIGEDYDIEIEPTYTKKYGKGYQFVMVASKRPNTIKEQQEYLKMMVTDKQYEEIIKVYPNHLIIDLMEKNEFDYTKIKGFGQKTYERVKKYIFDNMEIQEALVELKDLKISFNAMKKLIEHFGDSRTLVQKVNNNIYELCEVSGFGFKKIDDYALNRGDDPTSSNRIKAAIKYILEQDADRGNSWISIHDANKELVKLLEINMGYIKDVIETIDKEDKTIFKDEERLAIYNNYIYEKEFKDKLKKMADKPSFTTVSNIEEKLNSLEQKNGFKYTSEQRDAIKKAVDNNVLVINGRAGTGKCVKGDTLVFTEKGLIEIQDIPKYFDLYSNNETKAKIVSYNTDGKKITKKTSHWYNMGKSKTYKITTSQGYKVEGTPEHPLLVVNDKGDLVYKQLKDFTGSEVLPISINNNLFGENVTLNTEISYLIGLLVGDGSTNGINRKKGEYTIYLVNNNENIGKEFMRISKKHLNETPKKHKRDNTYYYLFHKKEIHNELVNIYGLPTCLSREKYIPETVLTAPKPIVKSFLQGLFDTDGSFSRNTFEYSTASEKLARQVHVMLLNFGIPSNLRKKVVRKRNYYLITITGRNFLNLFEREIGFKNELDKKQKLRQFLLTDIKGNDNINILTNFNNKIEDIHNYFLNSDITTYNKKDKYRIPTRKGEVYINHFRDKRIGKNGHKKSVSSSRISKIVESYPDVPHYELFKNVTENMFIDHIVSIEESESIVYDFTVPETHSFVANGIINHNTTVLKGIIDSLSDYTYISAALSGKAAKVLRENGLHSKTIHKMLMETIDYELGETIPLRYDIVIIDEASMVNNYLFYQITESLKESAKLIIVGDNGQLPAIGTGANFDNLIRFGDEIPRQELTIVHRQAQKSGILSVANKIREGEQINPPGSEETEIYGELEDMVLIPTDKNTDIKQMVLDIAKRNKDAELFEFQVITGRVDSGDLSVKNLNTELQKIFNDIEKPFVSRGGYDYRVGDKIIQNGNNYEARVLVSMDDYFSNLSDDLDITTEVFNGTLGKIVDIKFDSDTTRKDHRIHIKFEDEDEIVEYNMDELSQIGLAYALTVHKLQGSSSNKVIFAFDGNSFMLLCKEFIYTGITRAKKGCIMIAENGMLHMGIKKSQGNNRRTFLKEMLLGEEKSFK